LGASGVQRAALAGVLLSINLSIRERLSGGVGVTGAGGAEREGGEEGSEFGGLGWVGVGC